MAMRQALSAALCARCSCPGDYLSSAALATCLKWCLRAPNPDRASMRATGMRTFSSTWRLKKNKTRRMRCWSAPLVAITRSTASWMTELKRGRSSILSNGKIAAPSRTNQRAWEPSGNLAGSHQLVQAYEAQKHARACAAENAFGDACEELEGAAGSGACGGDSMAGTATSKRKLPRQADQWIKVERVKPKSDEPGSELCWLVACAPPTLQQLVTNSQLRREAPQLLLDFYEARLTLPKQQ
eukprot:scaffold285376_cov31-Tisochrysis_lutea.AAC.1